MTLRESFAAMFSRIFETSPMPWHAETTKMDGVYIRDAKGGTVARVYGKPSEARATAEFIISRCSSK